MLAAREASVFAQPAGTQKIGSLSRDPMSLITHGSTGYVVTKKNADLLYRMYLNVWIQTNSPVKVWPLGTLLERFNQ